MKSEWYVSTIDDVCLLVTDGAHNSPPSVENGEYMASVKDFAEYGFDFSTCKRISSEDYSKLEKQGCVPNIGDVLVGKDGARYFEDIVIYKQPERPALLSSIAILRVNPEIITSEFLYYTLKSPAVKKDVRDNYGSGSAIPRIVLKDFKRMPIRYPSIEDQRKITLIFEAIDAKIDLNNRINDNLEQQVKALFLNYYNQSTTEVRFTDLIQILGGGTPKTSEISYWNGKIPLFTPKDVGNPYTLNTEKSITEAGLDHCNSRLFPVNTVFVTARGTVGKVALAGVPMAMNQSCYALIGKDIHQILVYFYTLKAVERLKYKASGAVFDAIITKDFEMENLKTLSNSATEDFIVKAEPVYQLILNNTIENQRLGKLRDTLLPQLMSGELDVSAVEL